MIAKKIALGYVSLVISASFLDIPMLGLLAIPIFLASIPMCITFLFLLPKDQSSDKRWLSIFLIPVGIIGLSITVGYAAIQYSGYLLASSRNVVERLYPSPWKPIFIILIASIITTSLTTLGIKQRTGWKGKRIPLIWSIIFLSVPITIAIVKLMKLLGLPFGT